MLLGNSFSEESLPILINYECKVHISCRSYSMLEADRWNQSKMYGEEELYWQSTSYQTHTLYKYQYFFLSLFLSIASITTSGFVPIVHF